MASVQSCPTTYKLHGMCDIWTYPLTSEVQSMGPLARYVKLRVVHAPGMPGTFSPPPRVSDPDMHHGTCVTHVPWCMPGSLTSGFLWNWWRGKRPRHSRCMRNPQFHVSGKRLIGTGFRDVVDQDQCPVSISDKTSYREIWQSLEGARSCISMFVSTAVLPTCLSTFRAIGQF